MVLGRNGLRDERRRRVLIDETLHAGEAEAAGGPPDGERTAAKPYSEAARVANHAPISVCIPKRPLSLWAIFACGAFLIAGIESLYHYAYLRANPELQASLTALDLGARGSLANWFASVMFCCSALASVLVYLIRRHRTDDYRGRYRWWMWLAPLLLVLSINAGTGLHQVLAGVLTSLSGAEVAVGGKGWWLLAYAGVFFPIVLQLLLELWPSRLATTYLLLTTSAYVISAGFELNAVACPAAFSAPICHSAILLSAHLGVLLTILAYGRYVYLEAHDELVRRRKWNLRVKLPKFRRKKKEPAGEEVAAPVPEKKVRSKKVRVDPPAEKPVPEPASTATASAAAGSVAAGTAATAKTAAAPRATITAAGFTPVDESGEESEDGEKRLSKADRKRLRRDGQR